MKRNVKMALNVLFSILGTVLGLYVGGYILFARPVFLLVTGFKAGILTSKMLIIYIIEIFVASTVGGGIWCICDIIASRFRDEPRDD